MNPFSFAAHLLTHFMLNIDNPSIQNSLYKPLRKVPEFKNTRKKAFYYAENLEH